MAETRALILAGRGSTGAFMHRGPPQFGEYTPFPKDESKGRTQAFSKDGKSFAYTSGDSVKLYAMPSCTLRHQLPGQRVSRLQFSPLGTMLATWESYVVSGKKDASQPSYNLHIFEVETGKCVKSWLQKKQIGWEPQWTDDESLVSRNVNNEINFFEKNQFDVVVKKLRIPSMREYKLSSGAAPYHIVCYILGSKDQPSSVKIYKYPDFEGPAGVVASKSFFRADKVEVKWNANGSAALVLSSVDADKSGSSYYGEQKLYLLTTKGDGCIVQLGKDGPVYSFEWSPSFTEFCVVYGYMPAKATLYNLKSDPVFDFGTSPRNLVYYNVFGNILILAGFGNLNGHVEIWDLRGKKEIVRTNARDTTFLEWCPDGQHFLTATLSPRLRVANGYKVWHYTGSLIYEFNTNKDDELWEVCWQPHRPGSFPEKKIIYDPVPSIAPTKPEASKEVYRPPAARGLPSRFTIHDDFEKSSAEKSKASKHKKKRGARKGKKEKEAVGESAPQEPSAVQDLVAEKHTVSDDLPGQEKKARAIRKKLDAIKKLKELQASGKQLELAQLEKVSKEANLIKELGSLKV